VPVDSGKKWWALRDVNTRKKKKKIEDIEKRAKQIQAPAYLKRQPESRGLLSSNFVEIKGTAVARRMLRLIWAKVRTVEGGGGDHAMSRCASHTHASMPQVVSERLVR
jgi:hypothetical protein